MIYRIFRIHKHEKYNRMFKESGVLSGAAVLPGENQEGALTEQEWIECLQRYASLMAKFSAVKERHPDTHFVDVMGNLLASCEVIIDDNLRDEFENLKLFLLRAEQYLDLLKRYPRFREAEYTPLADFSPGTNDTRKTDYVEHAAALLEGSNN